MAPTTSTTMAETNLAVLRQEIIGNRIRAVHQSREPTDFCDPKSAYPEQKSSYWNWYIELENGVLFQLEEYTLEIFESCPEPTVPGELCATRMLRGIREFRDLSGSETGEFLKGRQITRIITQYYEYEELKPIFVIFDQS
jgi:hypothetical protein